jgi:SurA-like N-terminal domain
MRLNTMIKNLFCLFLVLLAATFISCSKEEPEGNKILARINDYKLCCSEFQKKLDQDVNFYEDLKSSETVRNEFLQQLIEEELLIQEAKKLELDRKEKFICAIERYWKSTLIRDLLEKKGEEIDKTITVSQAEIEVYYDKIKEDRKNVPPLSEIQDKVAEMLKKTKQREKLKEWVAELRKKADIDVNRELLSRNADGD